MFISPVDIFLAFALDAAIGDPRGVPHPVVLIGRAISFGEKKLTGAMGPRVGGVVLATGIVAVFTLGALALTLALKSVTGVLAIPAYVLYIYLLSSMLAMRGLVDSVRVVVTANELKEARAALSKIVGRETGELSGEGVRRAAVETLAENTSDGIIAPLLFMAVGGLPLAVLYKAVNTLDSMVGYRNDKYIDFGWASARLDDILNYIPARATGFLIVAAHFIQSGLSREEAARAYGVMRSDGGKHISPNAGVPEAAMAGALGLRFGGPSVYEGQTIEKPYINAKGGTTTRDAALRGIGLTATASMLGLLLAMALAFLVGSAV